MGLMAEGKNIIQVGVVVGLVTFGSRKITLPASTLTKYARRMVNGSTTSKTIITNLQLNTQIWMYPLNTIQMSATFLML